MNSVLDAFGPLREAPYVEVGSRVRCWAGTGTVSHIGSPFNGIEGIHAYVGVELDTGMNCSAKLDAIEPVDAPRPIAPVLEGMLF